MKIIGVTGGIGSGKSTACREFELLGAKVIDADKVAHKVSEKGGSAYDEIAGYFGKDILLESGELDRKKLAKIVFSDRKKLSVLNEITHKHIFDEMQREVALSKEDVVVLDVPLLFSPDFQIKCNLTIAIIADEEKRIKRVMERDGLSREEVAARIQNQLSNEEYKKLADICIVNNNIEEMRNAVHEIYNNVRR